VLERDAVGMQRQGTMSGVVLSRAGVSAPSLAKPGRAARLYILTTRTPAKRDKSIWVY